MSYQIPLRQETLNFLEKHPDIPTYYNKEKSHFPLSQLALFIKSKDTPLKQEALLYLLRDMAYDRGLLDNNKTENKSKFYTILLLAFLGFAGAINNGLGGFDGIVSILQLFTTSPYLLYLPGIFFSLISVLIFISFDFNQGANALGVQFFEYATHINHLIEQEKLIKKIIRSLDEEMLMAKSAKALNKIELTLAMMKMQYAHIKIQKVLLIKKSDSLLPKVIEKACSVICGLLFLFYGYFTGQSGAMFILGASSIAAGMSTPFGAFLMVTLGALAAIGSVAFYILVQRQGVESLVSNILGTNREKVEIFCKPERTQKIEHEIMIREHALNRLKKSYQNRKSINKSRFFIGKPTCQCKTQESKEKSDIPQKKCA